MNLQNAVFKVELEKQKVEKAAHARDPILPYFDESKDKMDSYLSRFDYKRVEVEGLGGLFERVTERACT